ncbi:MAG: hypothetical protein U0136_15810 [Bdellovibrionota bacterium]
MSGGLRTKRSKHTIGGSLAGCAFICAIAIVVLWMSGTARTATAVTSVSLNQGIVPVGDAAIVSAKLSLNERDDAPHVFVSMQLPPIVRYATSSAIVTGAPQHHRVEPQLSSCADGRTILVFALDSSQLIRSGSDGERERELRFTIDGFTPGAPSSLNAAATSSYDVVSCEQFDSQSSAIVSVP